MLKISVCFLHFSFLGFGEIYGNSVFFCLFHWAPLKFLFPMLVVILCWLFFVDSGTQQLLLFSLRNCK